MPEFLDSTDKATKPPFFERCWERVVAGISWLHAFLARILTAAFTWAWRVQGRKSLSARFSVGMVLLALGSAQPVWTTTNAVDRPWTNVSYTVENPGFYWIAGK